MVNKGKSYFLARAIVGRLLGLSILFDNASNSQFGVYKGPGVCLARMSAARQTYCSLQSLHFHPPWRSDAAVKPPGVGLRRSSTDAPQALSTVKMLKLRIAVA